MCGLVGRCRAVAARVRLKIWIAAYNLEDARQLHAGGRRYIRSALCCLGLAALGAMRIGSFGGRI